MPEHGIDYMPIDTLLPAERNPKRHDGDGIRRSIGRFGYTKCALIDERTGRLVAGHGRLEQLRAMRTAGDAPPDGVMVDNQGRWLMPVERGWASRNDHEAEAYTIASNRWTERGGWDEQSLAEVLKDIVNADADLLAAAGYTERYLRDLTDTFTDPTDLADLAATYGEPDDAAFYSRIKLSVDQALFDRWRAVFDRCDGADDIAKLDVFLGEVETHRAECGKW